MTHESIHVEHLRNTNQNSNSRLTLNELFMGLAYFYTLRSTCDRLHVGCVLVKDNRVIAGGYNGSPPKKDHCDDIGHLVIDGKCKRTIHAEANVINTANSLNIDIKGSIIYITHYPCPDCLELILRSGITRVIHNQCNRPYCVNYHGVEIEKFNGRQLLLLWEENK